MKKLIALIMILTIAATVSACFPDGNTLPLDYLDSGVELTRDMIPETYQAEINGSFTIDAKVTAPDELKFYRFKANKKNGLENVENIRDAFIPSDSELVVFREGDEDNAEYYRYNAADGAELTIVQRWGAGDLSDDVSIVYRAGGEDLYCNRISDSVSLYYSYSQFTFGGGSFFDPATFEYYPDREVEGIDREEAIALAREKLVTLGIDCEEEPEVIAITKDSPGVKQTYEHHEELEDKFEENIEDYERIVYPEFTSEDEAYYIVFNHSYEGMPISYERMDGKDHMWGYSTFGIRVVVGRTGIVELDIDKTGIEPTGEKIDAPNLFNVERVAEKLEERFGNRGFGSGYKITDIRLEYACVDDSDGLMFDPCWVCLYETDWGLEGVADVIYLDALTGELVETYNLAHSIS